MPQQSGEGIEKMEKASNANDSSVTKYTTSTGDITLSPSIIRKYLVNGNGAVTDQEVMMFLGLCRFQKLNPFLREAYLIKYGNSQPATIVVGKEAFLKRAQHIAQCEGFKAGIICYCPETGETIFTEGFKRPGCDIVGGWAEVFKAGWIHPVHVEVSYEEYVGRKADGSITAMWKNKPATMIRKVALVQALREAFPDAFGGMYSQEEINSIDSAKLDTTPVEIQTAPEPQTKSRKQKEPPIPPADSDPPVIDVKLPDDEAKVVCPDNGDNIFVSYCDQSCSKRDGCEAHSAP
jgi:phage recombination protein Bet